VTNRIEGAGKRSPLNLLAPALILPARTSSAESARDAGTVVSFVVNTKPKFSPLKLSVRRNHAPDAARRESRSVALRSATTEGLERRNCGTLPWTSSSRGKGRISPLLFLVCAPLLFGSDLYEKLAWYGRGKALSA
jgi:hypothetical protein